MPPGERDPGLEAQVAALTSRVDGIHESLDRNNEATASLREDFARLRGQINGHLPRIERGIERIHERLDEYRVAVQSCQDAVEVNDNQVDAVFKALEKKADAAANEQSHSRLWLVLKVSLLAIAIAAVGGILAQVLKP